MDLNFNYENQFKEIINGLQLPLIVTFQGFNSHLLNTHYKIYKYLSSLN